MVTGNRDLSMIFQIYGSSSNIPMMSSIPSPQRDPEAEHSVPLTTNRSQHNTVAPPPLMPSFFKTKLDSGSSLKPRDQTCHLPRVPASSSDPAPVILVRQPDFLGYRLRLLLIASPPQEAEPPVRAPEHLDKPLGAFHLPTGTSARWIVPL